MLEEKKSEDGVKTIQVDESVYKLIVEWAEKHHRTIGGQVAAAMETYLKKRQPLQ